MLGHFTLYDYNEPLAVPQELHGAFAVVVADPPYLVRGFERQQKLSASWQKLSEEGSSTGYLVKPVVLLARLLCRASQLWLPHSTLLLLTAMLCARLLFW